MHGKYLLKYLNVDHLPNHIREHGTIVRLFVRSDVNLTQIEADLKKWVLLPNCNLVLDNNGKEISIGMTKPSDVLKTYLVSKGYEIDDKNLTVKEISKNGVTLAFALRYVEHWKEWEFVSHNETERSNIAPIGTCIEGIRVDFNTPGFKGRNLIALLNTTGKDAPKTNVARSTIELTPERESLLLQTYDLYLSHISTELANLRKNFSITWAANELSWILRSFTSNHRSANNKEAKIEDLGIFEKSISAIECVLIESAGSRKLVSINDLTSLGQFWTIDCGSYTSADSLIKEVKSSNTSVLALLRTMFGDSESKIEHIDNLLCIRYSDRVIEKIISEKFQVDTIRIVPEQRRVDLRWTLSPERYWEEIVVDEDDFGNGRTRCMIQVKEIDVDRSMNHIAINSSNALFILNNSELHRYLASLVNKLKDTQEDGIVLSKVIGLIVSLFHYKTLDKANVEEIIEHRFERANHRNLAKLVWSRIDKHELISVVLRTNFLKYDTTIWHRRQMF